ncbi:hypothetical protein [Rossellomorea vietnamensis]|uniref:Lipoprotein n=1 Tax=Rossellomorea vietnamensis TaxID=218284 RepID=A0A6I6UPF8_9BACI|nr:hypothetical protein [Rossellomorea vietnamensis]OXS63782.1 hypothetical protein B1B00_03480 [Bacillus sp. DSM 27956]PRX78853.1 hypothetical protein B0G93_102216 [Bacillus sp. V-88]QHE60602.1 hypothetical protein FHE72_05755 [Rossellomorea vietnamensis]SLK14210.1 hypothetical protein SAMN06295884_102216 [Bacillus sp. V-88]
MRSRLLFILFTILFLTGCRVEMATELPPKQEAPSGVRIELTGTVLLQDNELVVDGQSNLPKDSIMFAGLKEYGDHESYARVINWQGEEDMEYVTESTGVVDEKGKFQIKVERVNPDKRYKLEVLFNPAIQKSKIQETYGLWGENIAATIGRTDFKHNGRTITGIIKVAPIVNISDPSGNGVKWNLTDVFKKSRPIK